MRVKLFWAMNRHIEAIRSEEDLRAIKVAGAVHSEEAIRKTTGELEEAMGEAYKKEFNEHVKTSQSAINRLKQLQ